MDMQLLYDVLTTSSEYKSWARKNAAARIAFETYWLKLMKGEVTPMPIIPNQFGKALAGMVSLFPPLPAPAPVATPEPIPAPEPVAGLVFPTHPMITHFERGGYRPVASGDVWKCETTGSGLSRLHWDLSGGYEKRSGDSFSMSCNLSYSSTFRGVAMRLENYNSDMTNLNQLELARYSDGMWYVVQALYRPTSGGEVYRQILSKFSISQGARVELRGTLSVFDGQAVTELYINGGLAGKTEQRNMEQPVTLTRARFGIVDTGQTGIVSVGACKFG